MTLAVNPTADKTEALFQAMAIQQNGTGAASGITGGTGAAGNGSAAGSAAGSASSAAAVGGAASLTATIGGAAATGTVGTGATSSGSVVSGTGQIGADGQCVCAVQCAVGSFPNAMQGLGNFGGVAGAIPSSSLETV